MKQHTLAIILTASLLCCGCGQTAMNKKERKAYTEFCKKLDGSWKHASKELFENWDFSGDTARSEVLMIRDHDTAVLETVQLVETTSGVFYRVRVSNQNEGKAIDFALKEISENELVFENLTHDFPQRIAYRLEDADHLEAITSGMIYGERQEVVFQYIRQP